MLLKEYIETGLDIEDVMESAIIPDYVLTALRDKFEGRCYKNKYISRILSIEKMSEIYVQQMGDPNVGHVSVVFLAECVEYYTDELVAGFKVINNDEKIIIAIKHDGRNNLAITSIDVTPHIKSLSIDQIIPIKIISSQYTVGRNIITCVSQFAPKIYGTPYYQIIAGKGTIPTALIDKFKETAVANEKWIMEKLDFMIPTPTSVVSSVVKLIDLVDKLNVGDIVGRPDSIKLLEPIAHKSSAAPTADAKKCSAANAIILMMQNYIAMVTYMNEMVEIYASGTAYTDHANLWKIMKKYGT